MKITKKNYPERLRKTINKPKPCNVCAATMTGISPDWWEYADDSQCGRAWGIDKEEEEICGPICRDFVKLGESSGLHNCPCMCLGKKKALVRAEKHLKLWDQGKHHWQEKS